MYINIIVRYNKIYKSSETEMNKQIIKSSTKYSCQMNELIESFYKNARFARIVMFVSFEYRKYLPTDK